MSFKVTPRQSARRLVASEISADVYGIKNCSTVRTALSWLEEQKVDVTLHDYKQKPPNRSLLEEFCSTVGWEVVLNKASLSFKKLPLRSKQNINEAKAIDLMHSNPLLIKRPIVRLYDTHRSFLLLGFNAKEYSDHVNNLSASTPVSTQRSVPLYSLTTTATQSHNDIPSAAESNKTDDLSYKVAYDIAPPHLTMTKGNEQDDVDFVTARSRSNMSSSRRGLSPPDPQTRTSMPPVVSHRRKRAREGQQETAMATAKLPKGKRTSKANKKLSTSPFSHKGSKRRRT